MPHNDFNLSNLGTQDILKASQRLIKSGSETRQRRIAQNIGVSGLSTSGVANIPQAVSSRIRGVQEAQLVSDIGQQQISQRFRASESAKEREGAINRLRESFRLRTDLARTTGRRSLQQGILGGGLGLITAALRRNEPNQFDPQTGKRIR